MRRTNRFFKFASPLMFTFDDPKTPIAKMEMNFDLSCLTITPKKKDAIKKIQTTLHVGLSEMPTSVSLKSKNNQIIISDLYDIAVRLLLVKRELKEKDSLFWREIAPKPIDEESDEDSLPFLDFIHELPLRQVYACLLTCRTNGMNHTIESPIKALQRKGYLSQVEINNIMYQLWPRISELRKEIMKDPDCFELSGGAIDPPYYFSARPK